MNEDHFKAHLPIKNPHGDRGWGSTLWDTHGAELNFVRNQHENKVWTLMEEDGEMFIVTGFHFVNRLGYFVTEKPWDQECRITIGKDRT